MFTLTRTFRLLFRVHGSRCSNTAIVAVRPTPRLIAGRLSSADLQAVSEWLQLLYRLPQP
jgi:hypothetical protein